MNILSLMILVDAQKKLREKEIPPPSDLMFPFFLPSFGLVPQLLTTNAVVKQEIAKKENQVLADSNAKTAKELIDLKERIKTVRKDLPPNSPLLASFASLEEPAVTEAKQ